jgi:hypothetical protein
VGARNSQIHNVKCKRSKLRPQSRDNKEIIDSSPIYIRKIPYEADHTTIRPQPRGTSPRKRKDAWPQGDFDLANQLSIHAPGRLRPSGHLSATLQGGSPPVRPPGTQATWSPGRLGCPFVTAEMPDCHCKAARWRHGATHGHRCTRAGMNPWGHAATRDVGHATARMPELAARSCRDA